jgi:Fe-S oxidoreductase
MWERIIQAQVAEVKRLQGKAMLIGECGHASRSAREGMMSFIPPGERIPVITITELAHEAFISGKLKLRRGAIEERTTYHDPCNISRKGWIVEQPRVLLRHICKDYVEMTPNAEENYCCGGGGGTVSIDEIKDFRMSIGGKAKADQVRATAARYVVTPCANCKKQVGELLDAHEVACERTGLHDLLMKAIDLGEPPRREADGASDSRALVQEGSGEDGGESRSEGTPGAGEEQTG